MKVSVITVCLNAQDTISDTLRSVANQSYNNLEHIIIDGGSTDNTLHIIKELGTEKCQVISEKDEGLYDALNKGIAKATGDLIGLVHADDFLADDNVIKDLVDKISAENAELIYADLDYVKRYDEEKVVRHWVSGQYDANKFLQGWMPPHPTVWVKKSVFDTHGVFDKSFISAADYEWLLRVMYKERVTCCYLDRVTVKMRVGGKSNASLVNRLKANQEDRKAWKKNGLQPKAYTLLFKPLSKLTQFIKK